MGGAMKGGLIRAQKPRRERIYGKGQDAKKVVAKAKIYECGLYNV